jgi:hypothetical protein
MLPPSSGKDYGPNTPSWCGAQLKKAQGQLYLFECLFHGYEM